MSTLLVRRWELILYGYIRQYTNDLDLDREDYFPDDIMRLLAIWCAISDEWRRDVSSTDLMIDGGLVMKYKMERRYATAFGTDIIYKGHRKTWKLKICGDIHSSPLCFVGIVNLKRLNKVTLNDEDHNWLFHQYGYALYLDTGIIWKYRRSIRSYINFTKISTGILEIELDLNGEGKTGKLKYSMKGMTYKQDQVAFSDINCNKSYCLAVAWWSHSRYIHLVE